MKSFFKCISIILGGTWLIYMIAVAIVLNTNIFGQLTGMDNPELTHVKFSGAFSPYPGLLLSSRATVFISDQNVSVSVHLKDLTIRFDLKPIQNKLIRVTSLNVKSAWINLGMKTPEQSITHISKYTEVKDVNLDLKRERGREALKNHVKLVFESLSIDRISHIETSIGKFNGELSLNGGFRIQPGAEVEVFPTDLIIKNGTLPGQFSSIQGKIHVQFDPFFIPDAPGNAVFQFVNAKLDLNGIVESLGFLNLTLRKLPTYQLSQGQTRVSMNLDVDHGRMLPGSGMVTDPSYVILQNPDIRATGNGQLNWKVLPQDTSELTAKLKGIRIRAIKDNSQQGTVSNLDLKLTLYGTNLIDAFHGVASDLRLSNIGWNLESPLGKGNRKKNVSFHGRVEGNGRILGVSGVLPKAAERFWKGQTTRLNLKLTPFELTTSFLPLTSITGSLNVLAKPIDFSVSTLIIPEIKTDLDIAVAGYGSTKATGTISNTNYLLAPFHQWKGHLNLVLEDTSPFVKALRDQDKLGAVLGTFAQVRNLSHNVDWEMGDEYSWFRFNEVNSNGIWKAYGSLINNAQGLLGAFEVKVASVPVGIRIFPDKTDVKLLPSKEWYNELSIEQPSLNARVNP